MSARFREAGYQDIVTNQTYVGGVVRQYGKFSFSRVFEAGHEGNAHRQPLGCPGISFVQLPMLIRSGWNSPLLSTRDGL